jgi:tRNA U34 2-thiouridine synthase MnmA/TrmU
VRHRGTAVPAEVTAVQGDRLELAVLGSLEAAARGQSAVLVRGDRILGGGEILRAERHHG